MKNKDLQELQPIYIQEANFCADDEISLIDLAMVLVRRKTMIMVTTALIIALGAAAALLKHKTYTFSTSIEIGSQIINSSITPLESPETLLAKIQHAFITQTLSEHRKASPDDKDKYKIKATIPKSSVIIVLEAKDTEDKTDLITKLLNNVTKMAIQDHQRIYESIRQNLTSRLKQATYELQILKRSNNNETDLATQQNLIEVYSSQLANLRETRQLSPPMKSLESTGISRALIVVISAFAGVFIAVFGAFFAEFVAKIKEKSAADR